jgi:hypothetical protein
MIETKQEPQEELEPMSKESEVESPVEKITVVAKELPTEQFRAFIGKDGKNYEIFTTEEALTEILHGIREVLKFVKS